MFFKVIQPSKFNFKARLFVKVQVNSKRANHLFYVLDKLANVTSGKSVQIASEQ